VRLDKRLPEPHFRAAKRCASQPDYGVHTALLLLLLLTTGWLLLEIAEPDAFACIATQGAHTIQRPPANLQPQCTAFLPHCVGGLCSLRNTAQRAGIVLLAPTGLKGRAASEGARGTSPAKSGRAVAALLGWGQKQPLPSSRLRADARTDRGRAVSCEAYRQAGASRLHVSEKEGRLHVL